MATVNPSKVKLTKAEKAQRREQRKKERSDWQRQHQQALASRTPEEVERDVKRKIEPVVSKRNTTLMNAQEAYYKKHHWKQILEICEEYGITPHKLMHTHEGRVVLHQRGILKPKTDIRTGNRHTLEQAYQLYLEGKMYRPGKPKKKKKKAKVRTPSPANIARSQRAQEKKIWDDKTNSFREMTEEERKYHKEGALKDYR